jgi:hypothetical protein
MMKSIHLICALLGISLAPVMGGAGGKSGVSARANDGGAKSLDVVDANRAGTPQQQKSDRGGTV